MEVLLYNRHLSSPLLAEDITFKVDGMTFSTRLHGGFHICRFRFKADLPEAWAWLTERLFYRLVITDRSKTVWEGRIEDLELTLGEATVTAYGYYSSLTDQPEDTAYAGTTDATIKVMLTDHCPQINADQSNIDATGVTVTSAASSDYLDRPIREIVELLADFGDTSDRSMYFAIWENRIPYFKPKVATSITWRVSLRDFAQFRLRHIGGDLYNRVDAIYGVNETIVANDPDSQEKYGDGTNDLIRYHTIPDLGAVAAPAAQQARDTFLALHKDVWPRITNMVLGDRVFDTDGAEYPSSHVRSGDVLRITDLVPVSADSGATPTLDAKRTFYIIETEYNADNRTLRIVPDTAASMLTQLVAKTITR